MKGKSVLPGFVVSVGLLSVALIGAGCGDDDVSDNDAGIGASAVQPAKSGEDGRAGGSLALAPATGGAPEASTTLERKIVFTAGIALSVEDVQASFSEVSRLAVSTGGFVEKSNFAGANADGAASLTIRVPASRYQDALVSLRGLRGGSLETESSNSREVTDQYTDLQSRVRNLERTEQQYLELLAQAKSIPDILAVQDRLDAVRLQVEQIQGRLKVLDDQTELATIDVTLTPLAAAKAEKGPKAVTEAFVDAWAWFTEASRYVAAGLAMLAVAAVFIAPPAALVLAVARVVSRRGRAAVS